MAFLARFVRGFSGSTPSAHLSPQQLARYCYLTGHFSALQNRVLPGAFMPPKPDPKQPFLALSVFVIDQLSTEAIHGHGRIHALRDGQPPRAFGAIGASAFVAQKLAVERNDDRDGNPPLHADIVGWPKEKSEQKLIALQLASNSKLHLVEQLAAVLS